MSRSLILSEQFTDSALAVANALREHREDRALLLASLTDSWRSDERIRAAYLWGSFGRSEADDLSDLDPWLIVTDEAAAGIGPSLRHYAEQTGSLIVAMNTPRHAPLGGGYMSFLHEGRHGLLQVDCYWQPQSTALAESEYAVLFDRQAEIYTGQEHPEYILVEEAQGLQAEVEHDLHFTWFMFLITAKYLARDVESDLGLMFYPKPGLEEAAAHLGQREAWTAEDWAVPDEPQEKVKRLWHLISKVEQLRLIAAAQGYHFSPLYTSCLYRYLDVVASILSNPA
ncbi:MAG: hypothetical protein ACRYFS_02680 [Janthinobacterium lividum]